MSQVICCPNSRRIPASWERTHMSSSLRIQGSSGLALMHLLTPHIAVRNEPSPISEHSEGLNYELPLTSQPPALVPCVDRRSSAAVIVSSLLRRASAPIRPLPASIKWVILTKKYGLANVESGQ